MTGAAIRSLRVRGIELPLRAPVRTAAGTMTTTPLALLDLRDEDGAVGRSYVRTYTPLALGALVRLLDDLAPELVGLAGSAAEITAALRAQFRLLGDQGLVGMGLAGIDMALWDRDARRAEVALADFLGAGAGAVAAYRPLIATEPVPAAAEAEQAMATGFGAIKVKLGRGSLRGDLETVAALGGVGRLMVDYNQSLSLEEALHRGQALAERGLEWIEEPIDALDLPGHARLRAQLSTPLAAGENLEGAVEIQAALELGAVDVLTLDAARAGGVTGWLAAAAAAERASVPVCSHAYPEFSLHLLAASPTGRWLEYQDYAAPILATPLEVVAGELHVPERPGAGLDWDERALARLG